MQFQQPVITAHIIQEATDTQNSRSAYAWLKDVPAVKYNGGRDGRQVLGYDAIRAISAIRGNRRNGLKGDEMAPLIRAIEKAPLVMVDTSDADLKMFLSKLNQTERNRFNKVSKKYAEAIIGTCFERAFLVDVDKLRNRTITEPSVMRFTFLDDDSDLPVTKSEWREWSVELTTRIGSGREIGILASKYATA